jgi:hypothetical protein
VDGLGGDGVGAGAGAGGVGPLSQGPLRHPSPQ